MEKSTLEAKSEKHLIPWSELAPLKLGPGVLGPDDYVVYGGTFDPIHQGHLDALSKLTGLFPTCIVAPATSNPWKEEPPTDLGLRSEMIKLVLTAEGNTVYCDMRARGIVIWEAGYVYAADLIRKLRAGRPGTAYWAVGEDVASTVAQWRDWSSLGVQTVVLPVDIDIHASEIRAGKKSAHPVLASFVVKHGLYSQ